MNLWPLACLLASTELDWSCPVGLLYDVRTYPYSKVKLWKLSPTKTFNGLCNLQYRSGRSVGLPHFVELRLKLILHHGHKYFHFHVCFKFSRQVDAWSDECEQDTWNILCYAFIIHSSHIDTYCQTDNLSAHDNNTSFYKIFLHFEA